MRTRWWRWHDQLHRSPAQLLADLVAVIVAHDLLVRARDRRPDHAVARAGCQSSRHRRHSRAVWPRSTALGAILEFNNERAEGRFWQFLLLSHAGSRALPVALTQLAAAGLGGHDFLAVDRHPQRHPGGGARRRLLG